MIEHILAGHPVRVYTRKTDDTGDQQLRDIAGLPDEEFTKVPTLFPPGLAAHPPAGSDGIMVSILGHRDNAMVLPGEHPDHRPKLDEGDAQLYNFNGVYLLLKGKEAILLAPDKITLVVGDTSAVLDSDGITLNGKTTINGDVTLNGKMDATGDVVASGISLDKHTHQYQPGPGGPTPTSAPQG